MEFTRKNRPLTDNLNKIEKLLISNNGLFRIAHIRNKHILDLTLKQFIYKFLSEWNIKNFVYKVINSRLQCDKNRRRSLGDIFLICKYYYPNCTFKEVCYILDSINLDNISINKGFLKS